MWELEYIEQALGKRMHEWEKQNNKWYNNLQVHMIHPIQAEGIMNSPLEGVKFEWQLQNQTFHNLWLKNFLDNKNWKA